MKIDDFFHKVQHGDKVRCVWDYLKSNPHLYLSWYFGGGFAPQPGTGSWDMNIFIGNLQKIEEADDEQRQTYSKPRVKVGDLPTPEEKQQKPRRIESRGRLIV